MAAFCGTCGKPIALDGQFCGGCGAPNSASAAQAPVAPVAPVASGTSALKIVVIILLAGGAVLAAAGAGAFYYGRKKVTAWQQDHDVATSVASAVARHSASHDSDGAGLLTKEEVSEIIGRPVTEIEMSGKAQAKYKTASPGFEAVIEIERKDGVADATQDIEAARTVTKGMAGGKGDSVAGIGDDAVYGSFNVLFVRRNDVVLTITPPNLQMVAQLEQGQKMFSQKLGSEAQTRELEKLRETMQGDPVAGSMSQPDATSGAVDLIRHSATERGNEYETKARLMARQLAEKTLSKIGT